MKNRILILLFAFAFLFSCKTQLGIAKIQTQKNISVHASLQEDSEIKTVIAPYKKELDHQMNAKISHTNIELNKKGDNPNLGNLLADFTLEAAKEWAMKNNISSVDAAVINIGGIRTIIGKGDILLKHVYEVMPFENELVIVKMSGKDMQGLFNYYLEKQKNNPVANLKITMENGNLTQTLIGGKKVDLSKTYYIATSDYLALGGDDMKFFSKGHLISTGEKLRDLYIEKFKQNTEVIPPTDIRLVFDKNNSN